MFIWYIHTEQKNRPQKKEAKRRNSHNKLESENCSMCKCQQINTTPLLPSSPDPQKLTTTTTTTTTTTSTAVFQNASFVFFWLCVLFFFLLCEIEQSVYHQIKMVSLHESKGWGYPEFMYGILLAMMFFLFFCGCVY